MKFIPVKHMPELNIATFVNLVQALFNLKGGKQVRVSDIVLEEKIAPLLEGKEKIKSVAVFGFGEELRLLVSIQERLGFTEVLVNIVPESVIWRLSEHKIRFRYDVQRIKQPLPGKIIGEGINEITGILLGPLFTIVGNLIMNQIERTVMESAIQSASDSMEYDWLIMGNGYVVIDLDRLSGPVGTFTHPLEAFDWVPALVKKIPSVKAWCLADLIVLREIKASREGLELTLEASPEAHTFLSKVSPVVKHLKLPFLAAKDETGPQ